MAAAVIQRAFRAWCDRFEDLFYIHIKCTATAVEDELYRATLLISLAAVNVRLKWIEFDQLRMGRKSQLGKFAAGQRKRRSLVVLGSHGWVGPPPSASCDWLMAAQASRSDGLFRDWRPAQRRQLIGAPDANSADTVQNNVARCAFIRRRVLLALRN